jgi:DNA-nicking Smr family endonuclease
MGRRLAPEEKALWGRVMATVKPLHGVGAKPDTKTSLLRHPALDAGSRLIPSVAEKAGPRVKHGVTTKKKQPVTSGLLDETTLSGAYARLDRTLEQAIHQKLRVVLLVTGHARGHDRASGQGRGAIAAVVRDWLAASRHASAISAVRQAHPRHGGAGALYIVLKR